MPTAAASTNVPDVVLKAFGVSGEASGLPGGQGTSVVVGGQVFKPGCDEQFTSWLASVCDRIRPEGVRLPSPTRTLDGAFVVYGWSATPFVEGEPIGGTADTATWMRVLEAGRSFHVATRHEPWPEFLDRRADRWSLADRFAWGELSRDVGSRTSAVLGLVERHLVDEGLRRQLVHGDLSGNVLLNDFGESVVIDFSPYCRPAEYADAVVTIDAMLWWNAPQRMVAVARPDYLDDSRWRSLLVRALIFRLISFDESIQPPSQHTVSELDRYDAIAQFLNHQ
jgi:uncharacterized protein (TIGR02569 family)